MQLHLLSDGSRLQTAGEHCLRGIGCFSFCPAVAKQKRTIIFVAACTVLLILTLSVTHFDLKKKNNNPDFVWLKNVWLTSVPFPWEGLEEQEGGDLVGVLYKINSQSFRDVKYQLSLLSYNLQICQHIFIPGCQIPTHCHGPRISSRSSRLLWFSLGTKLSWLCLVKNQWCKLWCPGWKLCMSPTTQPRPPPVLGLSCFVKLRCVVQLFRSLDTDVGVFALEVH